MGTVSDKDVSFRRQFRPLPGEYFHAFRKKTDCLRIEARNRFSIIATVTRPEQDNLMDRQPLELH